MLVSLLGTVLPRAAAPFFPGLLWRRRGVGRALALTFDDGPDPETTPRLLDLLDAHGARATFFCVGARARQHPALVRAVRAAGHTVGQHTDTHADPWRTPRARLEAELERATATLEDVLGEPVRWARPPYGHLSGPFLRWSRARGQAVAMWDAMPGDFLPTATTDAVVRRVLRAARPGGVVVLHEGGRARAVTPMALETALPHLAARGYGLTAL
ncbi:MAG: polysaccharide deacetylase family protein [Rhodothermales bacterium]|nr:polysaccharide deacetylase family protein [Rhodothermales bacterium]